MTQFDTDNLNAPHTLRELGVDAAPVIDTSRDAVERLLEGVTPGPWVHTLEKRDEFWFGNGHWAVGQFVASDSYGADARFIAAARDLVPALLARAEAAEAEVARLTEALRKCEAEIDGYILQEYDLEHPVHERYRQRDFAANLARIALAAHAARRDGE